MKAKENSLESGISGLADAQENIYPPLNPRIPNSSQALLQAFNLDL